MQRCLILKMKNTMLKFLIAVHLEIIEQISFRTPNNDHQESSSNEKKISLSSEESKWSKSTVSKIIQLFSEIRLPNEDQERLKVTLFQILLQQNPSLPYSLQAYIPNPYPPYQHYQNPFNQPDYNHWPHTRSINRNNRPSATFSNMPENMNNKNKSFSFNHNNPSMINPNYGNPNHPSMVYNNSSNNMGMARTSQNVNDQTRAQTDLHNRTNNTNRFDNTFNIMK